MTEKLPTHVAVRRRADGRWLNSHRPITFGDVVKYLPTLAKAQMIVRIDMGEDLDAFEFITRADMQRRRKK